MESFWNDRYNSDKYVYGTSPNVFFRETLDKLNPGVIFLPGEGEGRNSVYAAHTGWVVDAVDYSEIARQKAMMLAQKSRLFINYSVSDVTEVELAENFYDAAGIVFLHMDSKSRSVFHKKVQKSLKPGGILIIEVFSKDQIDFKSGGPGDPDMLYNIDEIKNDFSELEFETLIKVKDFLNEGQYHRGKASIIRAVAIKK